MIIFEDKFIIYQTKSNFMKLLVITLFVGAIIALGSIAPSFGSAQLETTLEDGSGIALTKMTYQRTIWVDYSDGGSLAETLAGKNVTMVFSVDSSAMGMQDLIKKLNSSIASNNSIARITDVSLDYVAVMTGRDNKMSIDYKIVLHPEVENFVMREYTGTNSALIDIDWRGFGASGPVEIYAPNYGLLEINLPISLFDKHTPEIAMQLKSSDAGELLTRELMNADGIKGQPIGNWHFLFDPTGIGVDAAQHGFQTGSVISKYTMGESSLREGIQTERTSEAMFTIDKAYTLETFEASDNASIDIVGFANRDILGNSEVFGVTPTAPEGYATTSSEEFPAMVLYGMAGAAAMGGVAVMMMSQRKLKKEGKNLHQTGIDPTQLTGVATSASSGGYQTVRGEAQVKGLEDYDQHRNYYDDDKPQVEEKSETETTSTKGSMPKGWKPEEPVKTEASDDKPAEEKSEPESSNTKGSMPKGWKPEK